MPDPKGNGFRNEIKATFLKRLQALAQPEQSKGPLAVLRRNAGKSLADAHGVYSVFYRLFPARPPQDEELYFLVATLFALGPRVEFKGDFGASMAHLRSVHSPGAVDRRMTILLDTEMDGTMPGELGFRLRQAVKMLASKEIGVDWSQLLDDLLRWSDSRRLVQKRWASSYFSTRDDSNEDTSDFSQEGDEVVG